MFDFYVDDELKDILNVDLLQSNTKLKSINRIKNYTGNKVFEDTKLQKLNKNYYLINERSLLSSTWDNNYYRNILQKMSISVLMDTKPVLMISLSSVLIVW